MSIDLNYLKRAESRLSQIRKDVDKGKRINENEVQKIAYSSTMLASIRFYRQFNKDRQAFIDYVNNSDVSNKESVLKLFFEYWKVLESMTDTEISDMLIEIINLR